MIVRWPSVIKPGIAINVIFSQEDWMPTLLAAAGEPNVVEKLKTGYEAKKGPREEIFYFGQGGELNALRWND